MDEQFQSFRQFRPAGAGGSCDQQVFEVLNLRFRPVQVGCNEGWYL